MSGRIEKEKTFQIFLDNKLQYLSNKDGFLGVDNKFNFKEKGGDCSIWIRKNS